MHKFDPSRHFQISGRPMDANGRPLTPLDLVIINEVPYDNFSDPEFAVLNQYRGCYGLVTYAAPMGAGAAEPYYAGDRSHPGWVSGDLKHVSVLSRRICNGAICSWDFWLPSENVVRIPYNCLIMNVFADYPWQMICEDGPSSAPFVIDGMPQYAHIELVLKTNYDDLTAAHNAAMMTLLSTGS